MTCNSKATIETKNFSKRSTEQKSFITKSNLRNRKTAAQSADEVQALLYHGSREKLKMFITVSNAPELFLFSIAIPNRNYFAIYFGVRRVIARRKKICWKYFSGCHSGQRIIHYDAGIKSH